MAHVSFSTIFIRCGKSPKTIHSGEVSSSTSGRSWSALQPTTMGHSLSTGNVTSVFHGGLQEFRSSTVGADSLGWNRYDVIRRFILPQSSTVDSNDGDQQRPSHNEMIVTSLNAPCHHDPCSVGLQAATRHMKLQQKRGQYIESFSQPIINLPLPSISSTSKQFQRQPEWIGIRLIRNVDIQFWYSLVSMTQIRRRSLLLEYRRMEYLNPLHRSSPSTGHKSCSLIFAFSSDGSVYVVRPELPRDAKDLSTTGLNDCIAVEDAINPTKTDFLLLTRLPPSWIPRVVGDVFPLPYVVISYEPSPPGSSNTKSRNTNGVTSSDTLIPTITFVGVSNQIADQLQWIRLQFTTPKGTITGRWQLAALASSLRLRQVWSARKEVLSTNTEDPSRQSSLGSPSVTSVDSFSNKEYITWTSAEVNGRYFLVCSRFDGRLISFCLNPSRPHCSTATTPLVPPLSNPPVVTPLPISNSSSAFSPLFESTTASNIPPSTVLLPYNLLLENPTTSHPTTVTPPSLSSQSPRSIVTPQPSKSPPEILSSSLCSPRQLLRRRHHLRTSAKTLVRVTGTTVSSSASARDIRCLGAHVATRSEPSHYDSYRQQVLGTATTPRQIYERELSEGHLCSTQQKECQEINIPTQLFSPSNSEPRRLMTSLLSLGRDLIVGGSSLGDLFWWALPRLVLRGSVPGLHQTSIYGLHRIINVGYHTQAIDMNRVMSIDQSGGITIIDTSLVSIDKRRRTSNPRGGSITKPRTKRLLLDKQQQRSAKWQASQIPLRSLACSGSSATTRSESRMVESTKLLESSSSVLSSRAESPSRRVEVLRVHGFAAETPQPLPRKQGASYLHQGSLDLFTMRPMARGGGGGGGGRRGSSSSLLEVPSHHGLYQKSKDYDPLSHLPLLPPKKHKQHERLPELVDQGGWYVNWSPELSERRRRVSASSALYLDALDIRKL